MLDFLCANVSNCHKPTSSSCGSCKLVKYCSKTCQRDHWKSGHRGDCRSPLLKESWQPQWCEQQRQPAFMTDDNGPSVSIWGKSCKFLIGNMPAFDHIKLSENEGNGYSGDFDVLFAACGDLRNVILSVNATDIKGKLHIVLNDREPYVMVRGVLLLIVFSSFPPIEAAEAAVHLWYSPKIPSSTMAKLRNVFSAKLDKMRQHLRGDDDGLLSTSIQLSDSCFMRCALPRHFWKELFNILDSRISSATATNMRHMITLPPQRLDYRERHLFTIPPQYRLSKMQYYVDGLVLPFGAERSSFTEPNPTLFDPHGDHDWLISDCHDPVNGWNVPLILSNSQGPENDLYGALHHYLHQQFSQFSERLQNPSSEIQFTLLCHDARNLRPLFTSLAKHVPQQFDRIDVSNLTDVCYLGVVGTLQELGEPLLKSTNEHATLLSLFMNYTFDNMALSGRSQVQDPYSNATMKPAFRYAMSKCGLSPQKMNSATQTYPMMFWMMSISESLKDFNAIWREYTEKIKLEERERLLKMQVKSVKRPYALKKTGRDAEDLGRLLELELGGLNGHETYVEWVVQPMVFDVD